MITLIIILVLVFVPPVRRIVFGVLSGILAALGLVFLVTKNPPTDRRGL